MKGKYRDKIFVRKRGAFITLGFTAVFILLSIRLTYVMVFQGKDLKERAVNQWTSEVKIAAKRGKILDRNGKELAISANVYRLDVDLNTLREDLKTKKINISSIVPELSKVLGKDEAWVKKQIIDPLPNGKLKGNAILMRRMESVEKDRIKAFLDEKGYYGFIISPDTKRYYPNNNFLAHVLGNTNSDGDGLMGIEKVYNKYLSGIPGIKIAEMDRNSKDLPYIISDYVEPVDGKNVVLTIDENIQYFAEKAAEQALSDNKARAISIIVSNPNNGEILAMVNKPDYNPNEPYNNDLSLDENQKIWRNRAVSDTFEPGSIFKVVTATAAMSEGKVKSSDTFHCNGSLTIGKRKIHCWKTSGHGTQTFPQILQNSCNVGFMELGKRLGAEKLTEYIKLFGLGSRTGIDLNGEASGIIKNAKDVTETDLATISFGQTNTLSPIQYLKAFNAIANGGNLVTPHLMKEISHYNDKNELITDLKYEDKNAKSILDPNIMKELRMHLESVIAEGGGKKAFIQGYHIAGKTGTAQKINENGGGYGSGKYIASFAAMAPADKPQISVLISIDEPDPSNYYAGQIATPVGKQLFNDIFNYLAIKGDATEEQRLESLLKDVTIPEVRGTAVKDGIKILKEAGVKAKVEGEGEYISDMNPKPGFSVKEGKEIIIYASSDSKFTNTVVVPNLKGLNPQEAVKLLEHLGLKVRIAGDGMVSSQSLDEGTEVRKGTTIYLQLEIIGD
ncbi:stage V sporulation protein D (sporulation-specific penicillin-binding protein) [Hathewaya proteolytica DSM 3090]|uniref:Stage V sporulation protein D (Sporulation-specific penicillin-binding protein) n=1 Tax=Hathewaya proteolytica DSM 3090 TaxID=1121331 RepID=A0A1M6L7P4_9CLOT|nr:stage V sporulation protein D (sporulation-specific penicillin-binding protein) [Hathewaya proteolytica DSM 3090]